MRWLRLTCAVALSLLALTPALPTLTLDPQDPGHYLNLFLVETSDEETAERVARDNGFVVDEKVIRM